MIKKNVPMLVKKSILAQVATPDSHVIAGVVHCDERPFVITSGLPVSGNRR